MFGKIIIEAEATRDWGNIISGIVSPVKIPKILRASFTLYPKARSIAGTRLASMLPSRLRNVLLKDRGTDWEKRGQIYCVRSES